jgi:hypothetical protein
MRSLGFVPNTTDIARVGRLALSPYANLNGISRNRCPVNFAIAFANAGASGGTPGSPMPLGGSLLGTM